MTDAAPARSPAAPKAAPKPPRPPQWKTRPFWLRQLRQWHWITAAISLIGLILFSFTGITLNRAALIGSDPVTTEQSAVLSEPARAALARMGAETTDPVPAEVAAWAASELKLKIAGKPTETTADEVYVALARPGGDGALTIDRASGEAIAEATSNGWVAYLNDLHKGRNTGPVWAWFIDVFAVICIVSALTGLALLYLLATGRRWTWPLVGLGLAIPAVLAVIFIH